VVYSFKTIQEPAEGLYKEKGSKFVSFAYPVTDEAAVREIISTLKKKFYDARHHCYGWMLGADRKNFRAFDDGEPNHSAGNPILNQIRSRQLTDVVVVVVRYFGGVKLGVSGLVGAYRAAAEDALNHAVVVEKDVVRNLWLGYDYTATTQVMKLVRDFDVRIISQVFADDGSIEIQFRLRDEDKLLKKLFLLRETGTKISWRDGP